MMLRTGPYPWSVKSRIAGRHGHLSNRAAAQLGAELLHPELAAVVLAHLSQECNDPALAEEAVGEALRRKRYDGPLYVAMQDEPLPGLDVAAWPPKCGVNSWGCSSTVDQLPVKRSTSLVKTQTIRARIKTKPSWLKRARA